MQRGEAMGAAIPIRDDIWAEALRRLARQEANGRVACRWLALAKVLDGMSREQAARQAGVDRQTSSPRPSAQVPTRWSSWTAPAGISPRSSHSGVI
jgi:hypothetical protein